MDPNTHRHLGRTDLSRPRDQVVGGLAQYAWIGTLRLVPHCTDHRPWRDDGARMATTATGHAHQ